MKIRLIADGSTKWQRMIRRWGISFLVGEDVLFDTFGDHRVFMENIKKQQIDLSRVRHVVVSHDDWDHIDGLWDVIARYKNLSVYVGPRFNAELKDKICAFGVKLIETPGPVLIRDGVYTTGELSAVSDRGILYEQALVIKSSERLSVVTGCAHPKLPDILRAAREHFHQDVDTLIGGFHLKDMEIGRIREIVESLPGFGVRKVVPLHCTGPLAVREFRRFFVDNYCHMREGDSIEV